MVKMRKGKITILHFSGFVITGTEVVVADVVVISVDLRVGVIVMIEVNVDVTETVLGGQELDVGSLLELPTIKDVELNREVGLLELELSTAEDVELKNDDVVVEVLVSPELLVTLGIEDVELGRDAEMLELVEPSDSVLLEVEDNELVERLERVEEVKAVEVELTDTTEDVEDTVSGTPLGPAMICKICSGAVEL
jgi:hypothetical protein